MKKMLTKIMLPKFLKGIDRPFGEGVKSRLIRSLLINWRLGNFFFLLLNRFHHKISKKPTDPLYGIAWSEIFIEPPPYAQQRRRRGERGTGVTKGS